MQENFSIMHNSQSTVRQYSKMTSVDYQKELPNISFSRQPYRAALGIINDILESCMNAGIEGILISRISQMANLSHGTVIYNCDKLVNAGIIKINKYDRKYTVTITENGIKLFYELQRFRDMARDANIRY